MRILLLSFYYPPDIGPGPLRAQSIVEALRELRPNDLHIDVFTTMPNRYQSLTSQALSFESTDSFSVLRIALPTHQSGMWDQAKAFAVYARHVVKATRGKHWDIVVATSSRLMTAALAAWFAKRCGAKLYLDIRDLFTDAMEDVLAHSPLRLLLPAFRSLERWTFRSADRMNVVSAGFLPHVQQLAPQLIPSVFTNGIDEKFFTTSFFSPGSNESPLVFYAGNIGEGQGLHHIIPLVAKALEGRVRFRLLGDGGRRPELQHLITKSAVRNVEILDAVPREKLFTHYREADVLFLHLNDYPAFRKVLPSKIFEYAATQKPILAGVAGHAAEFLRTHVPGVEIFNPCDALNMQTALQRLLDGPRKIDRTDFCTRYARKKIMQEMAKEILFINGRAASD